MLDDHEKLRALILDLIEQGTADRFEFEFFHKEAVALFPSKGPLEFTALLVQVIFRIVNLDGKLRVVHMLDKKHLVDARLTRMEYILHPLTGVKIYDFSDRVFISFTHKASNL